MSMRETSRSIDHAAADWAARLDRAALTAPEEEELAAWLQGDVRRQGALLQARAILIRRDPPKAEALPVPARPAHLHVLSRPVREPRAARKGWMRLGGALAASVTMGILVLSAVDAPKAYATVKGEIRTLPLADGSTVTLNTDTRIQVYEGQGHLRIKVLRGEVFVQSVAGAKHPLTVEVDGKKLQAAHAAFNVSKLENVPWQVTVHDGQVALDGNANAPGTVIASNARLSMPSLDKRAAPRRSLLSADEVDRQSAWRSGKLAFHGETLAEAARAFARYSDTRIVIADPVLAGERVIGLYAANNPAGFARAAAKVLDAQVVQSNGQVVISVQD